MSIKIFISQNNLSEAWENFFKKFTNSKINLSEAWENFFKNIKSHRAQKDISEALEQFHVSTFFKWSTATSWTCVGFSLEEERVMQQSRDKYFPQFENQGINQVGDTAQVTEYLHKQSNNLHPTR